MVKKYSVLIGLFISVLFLTVAILLYPGGSYFNTRAVGFSWVDNFMCNLFQEKALNGVHNPSKIWAQLVMIILPVTYAVFFINTAKKLSDKNAVAILTYAAIANIFATFLITVFHDVMLLVSTSLFWTCLVIITVFIFKTKLRLFQVFCAATLLVFYYSVYLWAINDWYLIAIMQRVNFVSSTLLILGIEYFTTKEDFVSVKAKKTGK